MKQKLDVFDVFKKWLAQVENEKDLMLKCLKSNKGSEHYDSRFEEFCANRGIKRAKTVSENPHQNRVTERMNMIILECARSMWIYEGLLKQFLADAVNIMMYLVNRGFQCL